MLGVRARDTNDDVGRSNGFRRRESGHFSRLGQDWRDSSHRDSGGAAVDLRQFTSATESLDATSFGNGANAKESRS